MSKYTTSRDALWKGIIEDFFEQFLYYFYPNDVDTFDFSKGFEFLDKELIELFPESENNERYVDKLVKVHTYDGSTSWILIHIEVQGYYDKDFAERMFIYYYRILDKYKKRIGAIAIFTDNEKWFHPKQYHIAYLQTELTYKFPTYKLAEKTPADFANTDNPFAVIMETAWYGLEKNKLEDEGLYNFKIRLVRRLKGLNYTNQYIRRIFHFIDHYVNFDNSEIKHKFEKETSIILQNPQPMGIREAILEDWKKEGHRQGLEKGIEQTKKEFEEKQKVTVANLQKKGFDSEAIAEIMETSLDEVLRLLGK